MQMVQNLWVRSLHLIITFSASRIQPTGNTMEKQQVLSECGNGRSV